MAVFAAVKSLGARNLIRRPFCTVTIPFVLTARNGASKREKPFTDVQQ
jgi:hypothetical protein